MAELDASRIEVTTALTFNTHKGMHPSATMVTGISAIGNQFLQRRHTSQRLAIQSMDQALTAMSKMFPSMRPDSEDHVKVRSRTALPVTRSGFFTMSQRTLLNHSDETDDLQEALSDLAQTQRSMELTAVTHQMRVDSPSAWRISGEKLAMHMDPATNAAAKEVKKQAEPPSPLASIHHEPSKPPMLTTFARSTPAGPAEWPPMCERGSQGTHFPLKRNREKKTGSHKLRTGAINVARSKCPAEFIQWAFASCDLDVLACSEALLDHDRAQELARELKTNGMKMHMSCLTEGGSVHRSVAMCHSARTEQDMTRMPTGKEVRGNVAEVRHEGRQRVLPPCGCACSTKF